MDAYSIPATSGIYRIVCSVTGKFYIGSAVNLQNRWSVHQHFLKKGTHTNSKLQRAWNKYGPESFIFEVIELVLVPELLTAREQYWFDKLKPFGNKGFNLDRVAGSRLGAKMLPHVKEALRNAHLGKPAPSRGKKASLETREKMRVYRLGKKHRPETIENMCATRLGHPVSEKVRNTLGESRKRTYIVTSPDGVEQVIHGISAFCREHGLNYSCMVYVAQGKYRQHRGWKARYPEMDRG